MPVEIPGVTKKMSCARETPGVIIEDDDQCPMPKKKAKNKVKMKHAPVESVAEPMEMEPVKVEPMDIYPKKVEPVEGEPEKVEYALLTRLLEIVES